MRPLSFLLATYFCFSSIQAQIIEFPHFQDLPNYVEEETLVILDIDDTLLIPVQMLGSDEWFMFRHKEHLEQESSMEKALDRALSEWVSIRLVTDMEIVEEGTEKVVHSLQEKNVPLMGLTTQGMVLAKKTPLHLLEQNIDLSVTAPSHEDHYFKIGREGVLFRDGILFTSGSHKGRALFYLLEQIGYSPKKIVFVNDKATHLAEVEEESQKRGVEFLGLRYSYSDTRKEEFCHKTARVQFENSSFQKLLSDQEAKK